MKKQQTRFKKYKEYKTKGIESKEEVADNPDQRIDQDFPGFPHSPSQEKIIAPQSGEDKATAALATKKATQKKNKSKEHDVLRNELDNTSKKRNKQ